MNVYVECVHVAVFNNREYRHCNQDLEDILDYSEYCILKESLILLQTRDDTIPNPYELLWTVANI